MTPPIPLGFLDFPTVSFENKFELISSPTVTGATQFTFGNLTDYDNLKLLVAYGGQNGYQPGLRFNGSLSGYEWLRMDGIYANYNSGQSWISLGTFYRPDSGLTGSVMELDMFDIHNTTKGKTVRATWGDRSYKNGFTTGVWGNLSDITSFTFFGGTIGWDAGSVSLYGWRNN